MLVLGEALLGDAQQGIHPQWGVDHGFKWGKERHAFQVTMQAGAAIADEE